MRADFKRSGIVPNGLFCPGQLPRCFSRKKNAVESRRFRGGTFAAMNRVRLLLYAFLREKVGMDELEVPLEKGDTLEDLYFWLCVRYPQAAIPLPCLRFAVNGQYVSKNVLLHDGDEVVLVPPVAGG